MTLTLDNPPVPSPLVNPKDLKLSLLRGQDFGSDGTTLHTATYDGSDILLDGVPLVAVADVKALDLTFDDADNALVVFTDNSNNVFVYDGSDQSTTALGGVGDPEFPEVAWLTDFESGYVDESLNNFTLTASAPILPTGGQFGTAGMEVLASSRLELRFNDDAAVRNLFSPTLTDNPNITYEFAIKTEYDPVNPKYILDNAGPPSATRNGIQLVLPAVDGGPFLARKMAILFWDNNALEVVTSSTDFIYGMGFIHVAVVLTETRARLYQNGTVVADVSRPECGRPSEFQGASMGFFGSSRENTLSLNGIGDNVRVSRVARYGDSDFTPPNAPFPDGSSIPAVGEDLRIHNDRQASESIMLSYRRGNDVFYRLASASIPEPYIWFDAADESTLSLSGSNVDEWRSKGAFQFAATPVSGVLPTFSSGAVFFPNPETGVVTNSAVLRAEDPIPLEENGTNWTVFSVVSGLANNPAWQAVVARGAPDIESIRYAATWVRQGGFEEAATILRYAGSSQNVIAPDSLPLAALRILRSDYAPDDLAVSVNGGAGASSTRTLTEAAPLSHVHLGGVRQGNALYPAAAMRGNIHEVLMYNFNLSQSQIDNVYTYLNGKWGTV